MGFLLAAAGQHHNVGNGKAVAGEVGGTVKVECTVNILQRGFAVQRGRVNQIVILPVNGQPRFLQALVSLKAIIPCFRPAFDLVDGKDVALLRRGGAALGQCLFGTFPHIVPQRHRIEGGCRGKAHVIENVVHIGLFQGSCWVVVGPCGGVAHLAAGNIMVQSRFQMGTDFAVHGQRHIVPANITAGLFVGSLVKFHIEQRVGLQALLGRDLVVLGLPLQQRRQGRFLGGLDDLRVVLH